MEYRYVRDDELYHYGVLGMKWGHRKNPDTRQGLFSRRRRKVNDKVSTKNK